MSNKYKDIDIKDHTYYFFNDIINKRNFDPNIIKLDQKPNTTILIYYIGYVTITDLKNVKINSANPLYLIFNKVNGYFEDINKSKYIMLVPTNQSKEKVEKYEETCSKIGDLTKKLDDYDEKCMKIKFNSDDKLPINKAIEISSIMIVVRNSFFENNKYYPQVFLDECLYKI